MFYNNPITLCRFILFTILCFVNIVITASVVLQLLLVLAPGLVFLCYLIHLINQENQVKQHAATIYYENQRH